MHKFQPRGIIKWAPFAALNEYQNSVERLSLELEKEVNLRSENYLEYIDMQLANIDLQDDILINYYDRDEYKSEFGPIVIKDSEHISINGIKIHKQKIIDIIV